MTKLSQRTNRMFKLGQYSICCFLGLWNKYQQNHQKSNQIGSKGWLHVRECGFYTLMSAQNHHVIISIHCFVVPDDLNQNSSSEQNPFRVVSLQSENAFYHMAKELITFFLKMYHFNRTVYSPFLHEFTILISDILSVYSEYYPPLQ